MASGLATRLISSPLVCVAVEIRLSHSPSTAARCRKTLPLNEALTTTSASTMSSATLRSSSVVTSCAAAELRSSHLGAYAGPGAGLDNPLLLACLHCNHSSSDSECTESRTGGHHSVFVRGPAATTLPSHNENKQDWVPLPSTANNSYENGYSSSTPSYNPSAQPEAELLSGRNDQMTVLLVTLGKR